MQPREGVLSDWAIQEGRPAAHIPKPDMDYLNVHSPLGGGTRGTPRRDGFTHTSTAGSDKPRIVVAHGTRWLRLSDVDRWLG